MNAGKNVQDLFFVQGRWYAFGESAFLFHGGRPLTVLKCSSNTESQIHRLLLTLLTWAGMPKDPGDNIGTCCKNRRLT